MGFSLKKAAGFALNPTLALSGASIGGLLGGGSKSATSTNTAGLPAWLMPYFTGATKDAQSLYRGFQPSAGTTQGIEGLLGFRPEGAQSALDLNQQTLAGDFLSPESNPWLQQTFDRGADAIQARIGSQFAGAGRSNSGAMIGANQQALTDLAGNIFGGNYQQERGRQMQASAMAPMLDQGILAGPQAHLAAGGILDDQKWDNLNRYTNTLSQLANPFSVSTGTQPLQRNKGAGLLGGALAGAQIGSAVPVIGTGIGAGIGGLLGLLG